MSATLEQLRLWSGTNEFGTSLAGLAECARRIGFVSHAVSAAYSDLARVSLPAIAHVRAEDGSGHFVVLYKAGRRGVRLADPARGLVRWSPAEFGRRWTGNLLLLRPRSDGSGPPPSPSPLSRLGTLARAHRGALVASAACGLLVTALGVASSYFVQILLDHVFRRHDPELLTLLGLGMVIALAARAMLGAVRQIVLARLGRAIDIRLTREYFSHLLGLPVQYFESRKVGEILSRLGDAGRIRQLLSDTTISIVLDSVFMVAASTVLFFHSWRLAAVALLTAPSLALSEFIFLPSLRQNLRRTLEQVGKMQGRMVEDVAGIHTIKAYALESRRVDRIERQMGEYQEEVYRGQRLAASMGSLAMFLGGLSSLAVLWVGGRLVMDGGLTVGQLMFAATLVGYMMGPMERLAGAAQQIQDAFVALDRLSEVLDVPPEASAFGRVPFLGLREGIRLESVSFRYDGRGDVLDNLSLFVPAGTSLAVVGESGSGKTTLCKLLAGFYGPTQGRILYDGVDQRDLDVGQLRARIGWVQQEPMVFSGSLRENIALARPDASLEEVRESARLAQLSAFVETIPEGLEAQVGERGINLSGGERQRLAVARAVLARPDLFILDEATSHLDTRTERAIQNTLTEVLPGRTRILIAHRLSTIQDADRIVVLDRGRLIEEGTHEALLAAGGKYFELWSRQKPAGAGAPAVAAGGVP